MEQRAAVPPGLPRANPTISYWQDPPDAVADLRSTESLPQDADIVIVGSGITGACTAYNLLERRPDAKIVMLEARQACSGATGRNGGHTKGASYRSFVQNVETLGVEEAVKIATLEFNCMKGVHEFARTNGIDCDSHPTETVDIFFERDELDRAVRAVSLMQEVIPSNGDRICDYAFYDKAEAQSKFLIPSAVGAISYEAGSISAYKFVAGVLRLCLNRGLNLQTNTPVDSIYRPQDGQGPSRWTLKTSRGSTAADKIVLAANGYTPYLLPALQKFIVPLRGQVTAQRPGGGLPQEGLATTYSFIYDGGYDYMISRPPGSRYEGDIVIGGGLTKPSDMGLGEYGETDDTSLNPAISGYLEQSASSFFGDNWGTDNENGRIRKEWTGVMGYTPDGFPLVDQMPDEEGLYVAAAFQGHGMVLCFLCAQALMHIILGDDSGELNTWFPKAFRADEHRFSKAFEGKKHVTKPQDLERSLN